MISSESPVLFAKACELFIQELTMRAYVETELKGRRTLQKTDIAAALSRSDMYDFLIDLIPREEFAIQNKRLPQNLDSELDPQTQDHKIHQMLLQHLQESKFNETIPDKIISPLILDINEFSK